MIKSGSKKQILYVCCDCGKIRNNHGQWEKTDINLEDFNEADISHVICPECAAKHYPELDMKSTKEQFSKTPSLTIISEINKNGHYELRNKIHLCGRDSSNDIVIKDPTVSLTHCEFRKVNENSYLITDMDSTNGVFINGEYKVWAELKNNDLIKLGKVKIVYHDE